MLKEDYQTKFTTLNEPYEIGIPNKNGRLRLKEIDLKSLKTDQLYPHRQVIRFNSTFLEVIDSWEFVRGIPTAYMLPINIAMIGSVLIFFYYVSILFSKQEYIFGLIFLIFSVILIILSYSNYRMAKYDIGGYTHYPIRFNRKTQKVYAFSPQQQKIIELNWHDLHFSAVADGYDIELRASLIDQKNIVKEEIIFPFRAPRYDPELIEKHLAFFKAYMQGENLKKIDASIPEFFDIYNRKESFRETFERIYMKFDDEELIQQDRPKGRDNGLVVVAFFFLPLFLFRRLGLIFSKIPQWPIHFEQECQIESNDPYDSTGKQRHLAPLVFTSTEKFILFLGWLLGMSIFIAFLTGLAYLSWNYW